MVKVCKEQFPKGSLPGQRSDGLYLDGYLAENIDGYAEKIADDMQFVGVMSSSTFEVRTGKSTLAQHIGTYYTKRVNDHHGTDLKFTEKNVVFNQEKLIEQAMKLPQYSCLILDEGDDLTKHHASKVAQRLRTFFRKAGQLNLFIILIMPNFFELPKQYAISRSNFLIDVKFKGKFKRGFFDFYSWTQKKWLYIKGKKNEDWNQSGKSFAGRFRKGYTIDKEKYKKKKKEDLEEMNKKEKKKKSRTQVKKDQMMKVYKNLEKNFDMTQKEMAKVLGKSRRTVCDYKKELENKKRQKMKCEAVN